MREVVRGDKHNLRKSANRTAQISVIHFAHCTDFVLCNLQIFSGCACHLEQLHAQSPFLFPIVFSINLIPFLDICSVLAVLSPGLFGYVLLYLGHCAVATVAVCDFGSWALVFHCGLPRRISPLPPTTNPLSNTSVLHDGRKHKTVVFSQSNALRDLNKHVVQICPSSLSAAVHTVQVSVEPRLSTWKIAQSCSSQKD